MDSLLLPEQESLALAFHCALVELVQQLPESVPSLDEAEGEKPNTLTFTPRTGSLIGCKAVAIHSYEKADRRATVEVLADRGHVREKLAWNAVHRHYCDEVITLSHFGRGPGGRNQPPEITGKVLQYGL